LGDRKRTDDEAFFISAQPLPTAAGEARAGAPIMQFSATLLQGDKTIVDGVQGELNEAAILGGVRSLGGYFDFLAKSGVCRGEYQLRLEDGRAASIRVLNILTSSASFNSRAQFKANSDFK
jgi:hypothetical protein